MVKVLAVSGGVDSIVMLDMLADSGAVVAHFNHGIREDSDEDERFVGMLARKYGVQYESRREDLGSGASEELARIRRYEFLFSVAEKYGGRVHTAHHLDDLVETVAINLIRGTGWRGLVPLDDERVERPMLRRTKQENLEYAMQHGLEWREDSTNADKKYLRNRVRGGLGDLATNGDIPREIFGLYELQRGIKNEVDEAVSGLVEMRGTYPRGWFRGLDDSVAQEILRAIFVAMGRSTTRVQRGLMLEAIRTFGTGKKLNVLKGLMVVFSKTEFWFEEDKLISV